MIHTAHTASPEHPKCTMKPCGFVFEDRTLKAITGRDACWKNETSEREGMMDRARSVQSSDALKHAKYRKVIEEAIIKWSLEPVRCFII